MKVHTRTLTHHHRSITLILPLPFLLFYAQSKSKEVGNMWGYPVLSFFLKSHVMLLIFYFSVTESIGGNQALLVVVSWVIACDSGFVSKKVM